MSVKRESTVLTCITTFWFINHSFMLSLPICSITVVSAAESSVLRAPPDGPQSPLCQDIPQPV